MFHQPTHISHRPLTRGWKKPASIAVLAPFRALDDSPAEPELSVWRVSMEGCEGRAPVSFRIVALTRGAAERRTRLALQQSGHRVGKTLSVEHVGPVQASTWPDFVR